MNRLPFLSHSHHAAVARDLTGQRAMQGDRELCHTVQDETVGPLTGEAYKAPVVSAEHTVRRSGIHSKSP